MKWDRLPIDAPMMPPKVQKQTVEAMRGTRGHTRRAYEDALVEGNRPFVLKIAGEYVNRGVPFEDLVGAGNYGMILAARRFNPDLGYLFITYAVWYIRQQIRLAVANRHVVRIPLSRIKERIEGEDGKLEYQDWPLEASLDAPVAMGDHEVTMLDMQEADVEPPSTQAECRQMRECLDRYLGKLPKRDAKIMKQLFGLKDNTPRTLRDVGQEHDLTKEAIRLIRNRCLAKMREMMERDVRIKRRAL